MIFRFLDVSMIPTTNYFKYGDTKLLKFIQEKTVHFRTVFLRNLKIFEFEHFENVEKDRAPQILKLHLLTSWKSRIRDQSLRETRIGHFGNLEYEIHIFQQT